MHKKVDPAKAAWDCLINVLCYSSHAFSLIHESLTAYLTVGCVFRVAWAWLNDPEVREVCGFVVSSFLLPH